LSRTSFETDRYFKRYPIIGSLNNSLITKVLIAVCTYIAIFSIILTIVSPHRYDYKVGDIPDRPIRAPRDVEDEIATQQRIETAIDAVLSVYVLKQSIEQEVLVKVTKIFEEINTIRRLAEQIKAPLHSLEPVREEQPSVPNDITQNTPSPQDTTETQLFDETFLQNLRGHLSIQLSNEEILTTINAEQAELTDLETSLSAAVSAILGLRIKQENLLEAQSAMREEMMRLPLSNELRVLGATIGVFIVRPNMVYDHDATETERASAEAQVEPVIYRQGQYIAQAGQPITKNQIAMLDRLGLLEEVNIQLIIGIGIIILIVYIMVILYLFYFEKEILDQPPLLLMLSLLTCLMLGLSHFTSTIHPYLIPSALGGMLITVLLHKRAAVIINVALSILLGLMLDSQFNITLLAMVTGMIGIYMVDKLQSRNSLVWLGLSLGVANMLLIWGVELVLVGNWLAALQTSSWGLGSGILSAVLTMGTMPIWENLFGVITPIRLVEISNPNTPLLKRMLTEAPGTYHHSIIVANLAESAADAIGANGLLARVGAYYHDIGKLKRPHYFKENMISSENPHDKMNPTSSTGIITSHTKEGLDLAKKYRVPRILHDFIEQHHGTSPVKYFYHKAKTTSEKDVKLDSFRHKGPRPKTPEVALVMLADTVEAAVRSLPDPTPAKIEALIRKLLKEKLDDGQLDDCHLTLKNLDSIASAFTNSLCSIFHERVEYPEVNLKEEENKIDDPGY